jgi:hypothetical protein
MTGKKIFLIIMMMAIAGAVSCSGKKNETLTDRWVNYGTTSDGGQKYYDRQTITKISPKVIQVWDRLKVSPDGIAKILERRKAENLPVEGWDKLDLVVILREIDCTNKTNKMIKIEDYNDQGKKIYAADFPNRPADPIPPGSIFESLSNAVCQ